MNRLSEPWYDPRRSWTPTAVLFAVGLLLVIDLALPGGVLDGGLWIPLLYAGLPAVIGVLVYVRTRTAAGRELSLAPLIGIGAWGIVGGLLALVVLVVVGLGRSSPGLPSSAAFGFLTGLLTYLIPVAVFAWLYREAARRSAVQAAILILFTPAVLAAVFVFFVLATY